MDELHYLRELCRLQETLIEAQREAVAAIAALMNFHRPSFDKRPTLAVVQGGRAESDQGAHD